MASPIGHSLLAANLVLISQILLIKSTNGLKSKPFLALSVNYDKNYSQFSLIKIIQYLLKNWYVWLWIVIFANTPDFDFLAGFLRGDINLYHHKISHSVGFAILTTAISYLVLKYIDVDQRYSLFFFIAYISHLLGDFIAEDRTAPYGAMFLWPFTDNYYLSPFYVFLRIEHGNPGDNLDTFWQQVTLPHNFYAMLLEMMLLLPLVFLIHIMLKLQNKEKNL